VIFSTLFAAPARLQGSSWDVQSYANTDQAYQLYRAQLDVYERLVGEHPDRFRLIHTRDDLESVISGWENTPQDKKTLEEDGQEESGVPVGLVILMEGAEAIRRVEEIGMWWEQGVRIIGPAWAGNRFCGGTREPGPMTPDGFALLEAMAEFGFILDLSHMDERAALQALDAYPHQIIASHSNALALLKGSDSNRHLSDRIIHGILERGGVIGIVLFNAFLQTGWKRGDRREGITLQHVAAQIDYICQLAGDSHHVGFGSDFDGGFGLQSLPAGLDTIADLRKLVPVLAEMGYSDDDLSAIMGENWLQCLRKSLP